MKIRLTYAPKDAETQSWEIDPEDVDNLEAEAIEIVGGEAWDSYGQWMIMVSRGNMRAIRALLWTLYRRTNPDIDFNEVRFRTSELAIEALDEEEPVGKEETEGDDTDSPQPTSDSEAS